VSVREAVAALPLEQREAYAAALEAGADWLQTHGHNAAASRDAIPERYPYYAEAFAEADATASMMLRQAALLKLLAVVFRGLPSN